jgi:hypothetical protein
MSLPFEGDTTCPATGLTMPTVTNPAHANAKSLLRPMISPRKSATRVAHSAQTSCKRNENIDQVQFFRPRLLRKPINGARKAPADAGSGKADRKL